MKKCHQHPNYKAQFEPRANCFPCLVIWAKAQTQEAEMLQKQAEKKMANARKAMRRIEKLMKL